MFCFLVKCPVISRLYLFELSYSKVLRIRLIGVSVIERTDTSLKSPFQF